MSKHLPTFRRHYATKANTHDENIKWWDELTEDQQAQARAQFSNVGMENHIYCIGYEGKIVSRQQLNTQDPAYHHPWDPNLCRVCGQPLGTNDKNCLRCWEDVHGRP